MRVLITGGAGFIGSHLCEELTRGGHHVTALDDFSTGSAANLKNLTCNPQFQLVYASVTNETVLDRLCSECDLIVHLAAAVGVELIIRDPVRTLETNLQGTEAVLKLARRYGRRVIIASTSEVYGKSESIPFKEDADRVMGPTTRSRWSYAESKAVDEFLGLAYWRQFRVPVVICRFFNTVGPRQTGAYGMVVPRLVGQALRGLPLTVFGDGTQTRCFCNVKDTVEAIKRLAERPDIAGEVFNVGSQEEVTILDLAERIRRATGTTSQVRLVPYGEAYEAGFEDMARRVPSIEKIEKAVGWAPKISLRQTLQEVVDALRPQTLHADTQDDRNPEA